MWAELYDHNETIKERFSTSFSIVSDYCKLLTATAIAFIFQLSNQIVPTWVEAMELLNTTVFNIFNVI